MLFNAPPPRLESPARRRSVTQQPSSSAATVDEKTPSCEKRKDQDQTTESTPPQTTNSKQRAVIDNTKSTDENDPYTADSPAAVRPKSLSPGNATTTSSMRGRSSYKSYSPYQQRSTQRMREFLFDNNVDIYQDPEEDKEGNKKEQQDETAAQDIGAENERRAESSEQLAEKHAAHRKELIDKWRKQYVKPPVEKEFTPDVRNPRYDKSHPQPDRRPEEVFDGLYQDAIDLEKRKVFQASPSSFREVHKMWVGIKEETRDPTQLEPESIHERGWNTFLRSDRYDAWGRVQTDSPYRKHVMSPKAESRSAWHHETKKYMSKSMLRPSFIQRKKEEDAEKKREMNRKLFLEPRQTISSQLRRRQVSQSPVRDQQKQPTPKRRAASVERPSKEAETSAQPDEGKTEEK